MRALCPHGYLKHVAHIVCGECVKELDRYCVPLDHCYNSSYVPAVARLRRMHKVRARMGMARNVGDGISR